jgi:DNA-binding NtrC family response regulator
MHASRKETAGLKTPQVQTPNGQLASLAAAETTGDVLALTLEIIKGLGAYPERIMLVRDGREEVVNSKTRQMEPKSVDIENRIPGGAQIVVTCASAVGTKLRKEIEAVLQVAALSAELCARKLWLPEQPEAESGGVAGIVGASAASLEHVKEIEIIARSSHPVMITGERGTGKTTTARAIHEQSARRDKPFLDLDCTSLTENLLEAELFGHEKGAFTGANERKRGLFEMADGGTLFLDEIAELPPSLQVKLLKAVEQMKFRRVGGTQDVKVNVRIIAATSQDLKAMTADGRFRAELFDRLSVLDFRTTPLREKREDVPALIGHRLAAEQQRNGRKSAYRIEEEAVRLLVTHDWPGNVRELQNVIARLTARVSDDEAITVEDVRRVLPAAKKQTLHLVLPQGSEGRQVLPESLMYREKGETVREYLSRAFVAVAEKTLEEYGGCLKDAGAELGVNRSNLRTRLREARLIVKERELRIGRDVADAA